MRLPETELIGTAAATLDDHEISGVQSPVPDEKSFGGRQGEQVNKLLAGERAASWHGKLSQVNYSLSGTMPGLARSTA